jgi:hypothetical protein
MTPPDGDDASKVMLPILGSIHMAAEEPDIEAYPILSQLFPSESGGLPAWQLYGLLHDIVNLYQKKARPLMRLLCPFHKVMEILQFSCCTKTNSYASFSKLNREKQWIAQIMKHMSSEKNERVDEETLPSVKWLCRHLTNKYETDYLLAAKQATGMPIISTMDAATTSAMAGDANLSKNQLRTINWYLAQSCGSRLMVPEQRLDKLAGVDWMVPARYGMYLYQKKSQQPGDAKPESVNYWICSIPYLIRREAELMLELQIRHSWMWLMGSKVMRSFLVKDGMWWPVPIVAKELGGVTSSSLPRTQSGIVSRQTKQKSKVLPTRYGMVAIVSSNQPTCMNAERHC